MLEQAIRPPVPSCSPRGPLSEAVLILLTGGGGGDDLGALACRIVGRTGDLIQDDDVQLALFVLYASSYGSLEQLVPELEWDVELIATRKVLEEAFERELRQRVPAPVLPVSHADAVARALFELTATESGPSLSRYFAKQATAGEAREFLIQRSIYTLREADPHSWAIPRLSGSESAW